MLTAVGPDGTKVTSFDITDEHGWNTDWTCPVCGKETTYVQEASDGTIEHFRHLTAADHPRISEGKVHAQAKREISEQLREENAVNDIELERPIRNGEQIIDIYLDHEVHGDIAVEIQCSSQSVDAFRKRTKGYNEEGIAVLWIVQRETYLPTKQSRDQNVTGRKFKDSVEWLQKQYYGRVYQFSQIAFNVCPVRLESKQTVKERLLPDGGGSYYRDDYTYYYKKLAEADFATIPSYGLVTAENGNGYTIARFRDRCWWK